MPWTIDFQQDTETKGTGTATTSYVGENADAGIAFSMSSRLDENDAASIDAFLTKAIDMLVKQRLAKVEKSAVIVKLTLLLNAKTA